MIYQIIIAAVLGIFLINLWLNLRNMKTPREDARVPQPAPLISVLIPARNEEANIRACVASLQKQDYPNFEILVLDDNSTDDTAAIVNEMAAGDSRIRLIHGTPLPDDWAGKCWACYQLAHEARGAWYLFVDADTIHEPHMLRSVLAIAIEEKTSLLSGFPRQLADTFSVKVIIPVFYFILMSWAPMWLLHRTKKPKASVGIGQFFLFSRDEYWRTGGHKMVQGKIVEDIWMGFEVSKRGGRHVAIDLSPVVSCNMYPDLKAAWHGLGRSIYGVAATMPVALIVLITVAYLCFMAPFFGLWITFTGPVEPLLWRGLIILQVALILLMRWMIANRFREPGVSLWFHPFGMMFYIVNVAYSGLRCIVGAGTSWKERFYSKQSSVD
jgi:chlorobactene glucosyltransferase